MAVTYSITAGNADGLFTVVDGKIVAAMDLTGRAGTYELTLEAIQETTVTVTVEVVVDANRITEITTMSGGRPAVVPQAYHDYVAVDSQDTNTHPHMGPYTHVATKNGLWSDPTLWDVGTVPGANSIVNISTFDVTYDIESDVLIKDIHVSGAGILRWAKNKDTRLWVDTIMDHGTLIMGEPGNPIPESATLGKPRAEIVFWQSEAPLATVRLGLNTMGPVRIQGAKKEHWLRATAAVLAGATSAVLDDVGTSGWRVGDTILFAATENAGTSPTDPQYTGPTQFYGPFQNAAGVQTRTQGYRLSQDEERVITAISGNTVSWATGLTYDHKLYFGTLPRGQVVTINPIVANKSRSIQFRSAGGKAGDTAIWAGADLTVLQKRAHIMFMFSDDVQVRGARALDMARTDTNPSLVAPVAKLDLAAAETTGFIAYDKAPNDGTRVAITNPNNVRGRYAFHVHGTGAYFGRKQVVIEDCVADTSPGAPPIPGWAMTQHNSRAAFERNIIHNVRGSGMVSETGNEIGQWIDNLVCHVPGDGFAPAYGSRAEWWQNHNDHYGSAYGNQARQILMQGNHATSAHVAYSYFQQEVMADIRQPDEFSLRLVDPLVRSSAGSPFASINPEQPQIPDFVNNSSANCGDGLYVEHRLNKIDRSDETPMLMHGFHCINTRIPFHIANYTQHYYVFDSLWEGFVDGASIGAVAASFSFANLLLRNGSNGLKVGNNYGGFITDVVQENVTNPYDDAIVAVSTANEDPAQHPFFNMMDEWVVTNNDSPSPGYTVRIRRNRSLNSQTDLPQPYPSLPLGRKMPDGSPPVPFGAEPYFLLDSVTSDLTAAGGGALSQITVAGTLRDSVGDRRFGDYQNPETPFANYGVKVGRVSVQMDAEGIVRRNGAFNDNGVWKSRLRFPYADRASGRYYLPTVDVVLTGVASDLLAANIVDPEATKTVLPLKPETLRSDQIGPPDALAITSTTAVRSEVGSTLVHVIKTNEGQAKVAITGGANAAAFEIVSAGGVNTLRYAANGVQTSAGSLGLVIRVTGPRGNTVDVPHTVNVMVAFFDDFTGVDDQPLEARAGWVLASGTASAAKIVANKLVCNDASGTGSLLLSQDMGSADHYVRFSFAASAVNAFVGIRIKDVNNFLGVRRNGNVVEVYQRIAGTQTAVATFNTTVVASDVIEFAAVGMSFYVKKNGATLVPATGTQVIHATLATGRQGVIPRSGVVNPWIDDYRTGAL